MPTNAHIFISHFINSKRLHLIFLGNVTENREIAVNLCILFQNTKLDYPQHKNSLHTSHVPCRAIIDIKSHYEILVHYQH